MSKSNVFWWLILGGWMAASTWWHVCKIKLLCDPVLCEPIRYQRPDSPLSIQDGDRFSVKRQLTLAGLPAQQLLTDAKGQNAPKKSNSTAAGRAANRRVAIVVQ